MTDPKPPSAPPPGAPSNPQRCSFCGEAMPARLFSGRSEAARICGACVQRFHKQIGRAPRK